MVVGLGLGLELELEVVVVVDGDSEEDEDEFGLSLLVVVGMMTGTRREGTETRADKVLRIVRERVLGEGC